MKKNVFNYLLVILTLLLSITSTFAEEVITENVTSNEVETEDVVVPPVPVVPPTPVELDSEKVKITSIIMKINDVIVDENTEIPIVQDSNVSLFYSWSIANSTPINDGDYIEIDVPLGFRIVNDVEGDLLFASNPAVGKFKLTKDTRKLRLTFNDTVTTLLNVSADVQLNTKFELSTLNKDNPVVFTFPLYGTASKTIPLKFIPAGNLSSVSKYGVSDKSVNATKINWVIDINKNLNPVSTAIVEDTYAEGLTLDNGSIKVYNLNIGLDGSESLGAEISVSPVYSPAESKFSIDLGNITSAYRIMYTTDINADAIDTSSFLNTVTFNENSSQANVTNNRGSKLEKTGNLDRNFNPNSIAWEVNINKHEGLLSTSELIDTIPAGLSYVNDSYNVYELTLANDGSVQSENLLSSVPLTVEGNVLTFTLPQNTSKAYKITYDTSIDDLDISSFTNSATLKDEDIILITKSKTISFKRGALLKKSGSIVVNYTTKAIDWIADINNTEKTLTSVKIVDTIGSDLVLDETSIKFYSVTFNSNGSDNEVAELNPQPLVTYENADRTMKIDLGDIDGAIRIKYTTTVPNHNSVTNSTNDITLTSGEGIGDNVNISKPPSIHNYVYKNTNGIDYSDKTMNWRIKLQPIKESMSGLILTDTFTNSGLILDKDSFRIYKYNDRNDTSKDLVSGVDYVLTDTPSIKLNTLNGEIDYVPGFKVVFTGDTIIGEEFRIDYTTKFDRIILADQNSNYSNEVVADWTENSNNATKTSTKSATFTLNSNGKINSSKYGTLRRTDREIDWIINANYLSETKAGFTIEDSISGNHELISDSIKVYNYTLQSNGNIVQGALLEDDKYVITKSAKSFEITFNETINSPYRVSYTTQLIGQSESKYYNTAKLDETTLNANVSFNNSESFISKSGAQDGANVNWSISLNESLSNISEVKIEDILTVGHEYIIDTFKVYKEPGKVLVDPSKYQVKFTIFDFSTREQKFELQFLNPISDEYIIEYSTEITASVDSTPISNSVTLTGVGVSIINDNSTKQIIAEVTEGSGAGRGDKGKFKIIKRDGSNNTILLKDVTFILLDSNKNILGTLPTTDENGEILVDRMNMGTYFIKETIGPSGYLAPDGSLIEVIIDSIEEKLVYVDNNKPAPIIPTSPRPEPEPVPEPEVEEEPVEEEPEKEPQEEPEPETKPEPKPKKDLVKVKKKPGEQTEYTPPEGHIPSEIVEEPSNGTVTFEDGEVVYTPDEGYSGADSFIVTVIKDDEVTYITFEIEDEETPLGAVTLPQTGEGNSYLTYILGIFVVVLGFIFIRKSK